MAARCSRTSAESDAPASEPAAVDRGSPGASSGSDAFPCRRSRLAAARAFLARSRSSLPKLVRCALICCPFWEIVQPPAHPAGANPGRRRSDDPDVLGFLPLAPGPDVELDDLTGLERPVARSLDVGVVDEDVVTLLAGDESEALLSIEELHRACCQRSLFSHR